MGTNFKEYVQRNSVYVNVLGLVLNDFNFNINILSVTHFISWRCSYWRPNGEGTL